MVLRQRFRADNFFDELRTELRDRKVAIIGIEGRTKHWAVGTGFEDNVLNVMDSDVRREMNREEVLIGSRENKEVRRSGNANELYLMPKQTLLIGVEG